jgi:hypothetical protein
MRISLLVVAYVSLMTGTAFGRVIDSYRIVSYGTNQPPVFSSPVSVTTALPDNDNALIGNLNAVKIPRPGISLIAGGGDAIFDFEFTVHASSGTTEYLIFNQLTNVGLEPWTGYRFQIGRGTGDNFQPAGGVSVPELQLPDFDFSQFDPAPTSNFFGTVSTSPYQLLWSNGTVPRNSLATFTLSIDVPNDIGADLYSTFTLRQITIVPEPSILLLASLGAISLVLARRRMRS